MVMRTVALCTVFAMASAQTGGANPDRKQPAGVTLDARQLMTSKAFKAAGLSKLDPDELDALNQWLTEFAVRLFSEKEKRSGGCETAVETSINGEFKGWSGDTVFELLNGQIWKQTSYDYEYEYEYSPSITIYNTSSGCKMRVDGVKGAINVRRLK